LIAACEMPRSLANLACVMLTLTRRSAIRLEVASIIAVLLAGIKTTVIADSPLLRFPFWQAIEVDSTSMHAAL